MLKRSVNVLSRETFIAAKAQSLLKTFIESLYFFFTCFSIESLGVVITILSTLFAFIASSIVQSIRNLLPIFFKAKEALSSSGPLAGITAKLEILERVFAFFF